MSEHEEQCALFEWLETMTPRYPEMAFFFAIPNGTWTKPQVAVRMKREGVKRGIPDIFGAVPRGKHAGIFIEMKTAIGRTSPEQKMWLKALAERGYLTAVCRSWEDAAKLIEDYLNDRN